MQPPVPKGEVSRFDNFPITANALHFALEGKSISDERSAQQIAYLARRLIVAYAKAIIFKKSPFPLYCKDSGYMDGLELATCEWIESLGFNVFVKPNSGAFYIHFADHTVPHAPLDEDWTVVKAEDE